MSETTLKLGDLVWYLRDPNSLHLIPTFLTTVLLFFFDACVQGQNERILAVAGKGTCSAET